MTVIVPALGSRIVAYSCVWSWYVHIQGLGQQRISEALKNKFIHVHLLLHAEQQAKKMCLNTAGFPNGILTAPW